MMKAKTLDDYLTMYGDLITQMTKERFAPLFQPGEDRLLIPGLQRQLYPSQADVVGGIIRAWDKQKSVFLSGECGTGKTTMAIAATHGKGAPNYRVLVFCPDHLTRKWAEVEIPAVLPDAKSGEVMDWRDVLKWERTKPAGAEWYVIGRDKSKLGAKWRAAFYTDRHGSKCCPDCQAPLVKKISDDGETIFWTTKELSARKRQCRRCGGMLWQYTRKLSRWAPAAYIHKHLRGFFDFVIIDEVHEEKGETTAQATASGSLAASGKKVLAMTGTLIGGYADHLRPLLFRLSPKHLVREGLDWSARTEFIRRYGRRDTIITQRDGGRTRDNRQSRGSTRSKRTQPRPGIMPTLYGNHLVENTVFVQLDQMEDHLPPMIEEKVPVEMSKEVAAAYDFVERPLREAVKALMKKRNRQLLGAMLQTLLTYPDYPFDWQEIGYLDNSGDRSGDEGRWVSVVVPPHLPATVQMAKERELINLLIKEKIEGRQSWVFVESTTKHPVLDRLEDVLRKAGLRVKVMRQKEVPRKHRDAWIAKHAPNCDVVLSHPRLVETGVDLFDKEHSPPTYNFATLIFFQTGYNLFTLRQASRRAWRLAQTETCRVFYLYFENTMQARAIDLMGKKLKASLALEGKFSAEGLAALAADEDNLTMELAKMLAEKLKLTNTTWAEKTIVSTSDDDWDYFVSFGHANEPVLSR